MSIYSGFATRFQEESYDHCIDSLLYILQKRIIKFYTNQKTDEEKFITLILKLHSQMKNMERNKYLQPKSSQSVTELIKYLENYEDQQHYYHSNTTQKIQSQQIQPVKIVEQPQVSEEKLKKKNSLWVEKVQAEDKQKQVNEQQVQTLGTLNKGAKQNTSDQKMQFKRTQYKLPNKRVFNYKSTSRTHLSRQKLSQDGKNNGMMSNYMNQKPSIQSKVTYYNKTNSQANHIQKRKNKSLSRNNNETQLKVNQNEVSDIIKDYIIKAKKSYTHGRKYKNQESFNRLHDI